MQPAVTESHLFGQERRPDLTKLSIWMVGVFLAYWVFTWLEVSYLQSIRYWSNLDRVTAEPIYVGGGIFLLLEMVIVIFVFRASGPRLMNPARPDNRHPLLYDAISGIGGGVLGFFVVIPVLGAANARLFLNSIVPAIHPIHARSILYFLLFGFALPIAIETLFRGIVLRTLEAYVSPVAAILLSAVLSARLWPDFSFVAGTVLGIVAGFLYRWRQNLVPAIIAHVVMKVSAGIYVLWLIWWRY